MKLPLHAAAGCLALLAISTFWVSTVTSELFGDNATIASVKQMVLWGMLILVPAMATVGATGASLGKGWRLPQVVRKQKRMKIIAANGLLILLPSAVFLATRAGTGTFDGVFYVVQGVELIAGATNITLLSRSLKDGLSLRKRRQSRAKA
ncbi:hypothetical protein [uncultured Shimia sp.]|uniref:hypothetical protein n=1 Tax=uncultured Shimia sp. TaxID=573152 RepID=UPI00260DE3DA|nr:hypothetical protein [uncultured Shimia sp.]